MCVAYLYLLLTYVCDIHLFGCDIQYVYVTSVYRYPHYNIGTDLWGLRSVSRLWGRRSFSLVSNISVRVKLYDMPLSAAYMHVTYVFDILLCDITFNVTCLCVLNMCDMRLCVTNRSASLTHMSVHLCVTYVCVTYLYILYFCMCINV